MMPLPCGRIDRHDAHTWTRHPHHEGGYGSPVTLMPSRTYHCHGGPLIEGGYWDTWDAEDDAADEHAAQQRREAA